MPILDRKRLHNLFGDPLRFLHQLRLVRILPGWRLRVFAVVVRGVDRNDDVGFFLFEAEEEQVDGCEFCGFLVRVGVWG